MHRTGILFNSCLLPSSFFSSSCVTSPKSPSPWAGPKYLLFPEELRPPLRWQMWPPPSHSLRGLSSSQGPFRVVLSPRCPLHSPHLHQKHKLAKSVLFSIICFFLKYLTFIPLASVAFAASGKQLMGSFRNILPLSPGGESALGFFLLQGVFFPPFPVEAERVFGWAAVSVCLLVAACCIDRPTCGRCTLNTGCLDAPSAVKMHWMEASRISAAGMATVWVPASRVLLDRFWHLQTSGFRGWTRGWEDADWAGVFFLCRPLLPEDLSG